MTTAAHVADRVARIITEQIGYQDEPITPAAKLIEDLGFDALDCVEIVMACEEAFGIEIHDEDAEAVVTVGDLTKLCERLYGK